MHDSDSANKTYVRTDEHGVMRVGDTRVMLDGVVYAFLDGVSAEEIQRDYPSLTLEDVYGAIAYYLGHRDEVEAYLRRQDEVWEAARAKAEEQPSPVVERLRALRKAAAEGNP